MKRQLPLLLLALYSLSVATMHAQAPPAGIRVSTWVREDIFAGFLVNDVARFDAGMKKVADSLAANPRAADAIAWRAAGEMYLAVRAHESGNAEAFRQRFAQAKTSFLEASRVAHGTPYMEALHAITGGTFTVFADRLPADLRRDAWTQVRFHYGSLRDLQKANFDRMPLHMKGEVIAGLAMAAQRLGDSDAPQRLREVIDTVPGTPYANRVKKWLDTPAAAATSSIACQTCHDPGKLANVTAAKAK